MPKTKNVCVSSPSPMATLHKKTVFGAQKIAFNQLQQKLLTCESLHDEVQVIQSCIGLKPTHLAARLEFTRKMEIILQKVCGDSFQCVLFGSSVNGFALEDSDLDIRLLFPAESENVIQPLTGDLSSDIETKIAHHFDKVKIKPKDITEVSSKVKEFSNGKKRQRMIIETLHPIFASNGSVFSTPVVVGKGRISILKFMFASHSVELSTGGNKALLNTSFFHKLASNSCFKQFVTIFQWIIQASVFYNNKKLPRLSTYIVLCITSTLLAEVYPSFRKSLQNALMKTENTYFSQALIDFQFDITSVLSQSLMKLSEVDFGLFVFSPLLGGLVPFTRLYIPEITSNFALGHLNVQDPFEPDHNISSLIYSMAGWKKEFQRLSETFSTRQKIADFYTAFEISLPETVSTDDVGSFDITRLGSEVIVISDFFLAPHAEHLTSRSNIDFELWCWRVFAFINYILNSILHADLQNKLLIDSLQSTIKEVLDSENDESSENTNFPKWPVFFDLGFKLNTWQNRRVIRKRLSKVSSASLNQEVMISSELLKMGCPVLSEPLKLVLLLEPDFVKLRLKYSVMSGEVDVVKKTGILETMGTLIPSLCNKYLFELPI